MKIVCCEKGHFFDYDYGMRYICPICDEKLRREQEMGDLGLDQVRARREIYYRNLYGICLATKLKEPWENADQRASDFVKEYSKKFTDFWSQNKYYSYEYMRYEHRDNYSAENGIGTSFEGRYGYGFGQVIPENWGTRCEIGLSFADTVWDREANKYVSYEFIILGENIRCKTLYICVDGENRFLRISAPLKFNSSEIKAAYGILCEKIALQNASNDFGFFICNKQNIAYRYNCPINKEFNGEEFDRLLKSIIGEIVSGIEYLSFVVNNYRFGGTIMKREQGIPQNPPNLKKCPNGHFYTANSTESCPFCAVEGKNEQNQMKETKRSKIMKKIKKKKQETPVPPVLVMPPSSGPTTETYSPITLIPETANLKLPEKNKDIRILYGCPNAKSIAYAGLEDYLQIEEKVYKSNNDEEKE